MGVTVRSRAAALLCLLVVGCAPAPPPPAVGSPAVPAGCELSPAAPVPEMIGVLWRCELAAAGVDRRTAEDLVADAVTVAACESAWNPAAVAYAGRYVDTPNPLTGSVHTAAGVFQLRRDDADRHVPGGYAAALDPVANIVGAARLFVAGYAVGGRSAGFAPWPCAAGPASVLPGFPGGPPSLPSWAYLY